MRPGTVKCPNCGTRAEWTRDSPWRPFCSERCRLVDLGAWFAEAHAIPADSTAEAGEQPRPPARGRKKAP